MTERGHIGLIVLVFAVLMAWAILLYRILPVAGITLGVGAGAVAVVVMAHLGVLAVLIAPFLALRRRSRNRRT